MYTSETLKAKLANINRDGTAYGATDCDPVFQTQYDTVCREYITLNITIFCDLLDRLRDLDMNEYPNKVEYLFGYDAVSKKKSFADFLLSDFFKMSDTIRGVNDLLSTYVAEEERNGLVERSYAVFKTLSDMSFDFSVERYYGKLKATENLKKLDCNAYDIMSYKDAFAFSLAN